MVSSVKRFLRNPDGSAATMAGLILPLILAAAGACADFTRQMQVRSDTQHAIDVAALTMLKELATGETSMTEDAMKHRAAILVDLNLVDPHANVTVVDVVLADSTLRIDSTVRTRLFFGGLIGITPPDMPLTSMAEVVGSNEVAGDHDVMMVLDNTYSLSSLELQRLRDAAKGLVNDLDAKAAEAGIEIRTGVVPFARYVNVGLGQSGAPWIDFTHARNPDGTAWEGCVHQFYDAGDEAVALAGPVEAGYTMTSGSDPARCLVSPITPLTASSSEVKAALDRIHLHAGGSTYIPGGLAWGRRMLEPDNPLTAHAAKPDAQRTLVLFSDGGNKLYWVRADEESDAATKAICSAIKREGTRIIVVAYDLQEATADNLRAMDVLTDCASSSALLVTAADADGLLAAFAGIGSKITTAESTPRIALVR